jgi:hypothetical protein
MVECQDFGNEGSLNFLPDVEQAGDHVVLPDSVHVTRLARRENPAFCFPGLPYLKVTDKGSLEIPGEG